MSDASPSFGTVTKRVVLGRFVLVIGDQAGTAIADDGTRGDPDALAKAIEHFSKEQPPQLGDRLGPDEPTEDEQGVADRLEHSLHLFTDFAEGRRDLASISDEANFLLDLLQRLDHDERWAEAIQVARVLAKLLALLARWKDLLSSLRLALSLAERISDDDGAAWALHELGILHLAAGKRAAADPLLTRAHAIRQHTGDRHALTLLERNLQVFCHSLRTDLHSSRWRQFKQIPNARAIAAALAATLLVLGGGAGAFVNGSDGKPAPPEASVTIESSPHSPRPGEQVTFKVVTNTKADPYFWWFGDGGSSSAARPSHKYKHPGNYRAIVVVTDRSGAIVASASRMIHIASPPPKTRVSIQVRSPTAGGPFAGQPIGLQANASTPSGVRISSYHWRFGDEGTSTEAAPFHTYKESRPYTIELTVTDSRRSTATAHRTIVIHRPPLPRSEITASCPPSPVILGTSVTVEGTVTPAPASETHVTVLYRTPSEAIQRETNTDTAGAYTSTATTSQTGKWSVSSSWPGDTKHAPATSAGCSFEVRTREELSSGSGKSPGSFTARPPSVSRSSALLRSG